MRLEGKKALVTGASHGLGRAICRSLAREGARVACMARPSSRLTETVAELEGAGAGALAVPADVTREPEVAAGVAAAAKQGGLDIVVLNAGTWNGAPIHETSEQLWDSLVDLNLKGAFLVLKHSIPHLIQRPGATVVGIGSIGGLVGQPNSAAYAASKWGLRGLLESAALELRPRRVRVSLVHPHNINSEERAIEPNSPERERTIEPVDIADLVAFVCAAPPHLSIGHMTVWPIAAGIASTMK